MRLYTYVVVRDYGFAPNPFFGRCTLATCKPDIRDGAQVGDWVAGTGSKSRGMGDRLIYAMRVGEVLTFDEYWEDPRFRSKRPNLCGSIKQAFGDNIYHHDSSTGHWSQEKSHHTHHNGQTNHTNLATDTKANRVLVSDWFVYFGKDAVEIPARFRQDTGRTVIAGRGHRVNFHPGFEEDFIQWIRSLGQEGFRGAPMKFQAQLVKTGVGIAKRMGRRT